MKTNSDNLVSIRSKISIFVFLFIVVFVILLSEITVLGEEMQNAKIVQTVYPVEEAVIADIVVTEEPYYADDTGETDCTEIIQNAIDDCAEMGGGTVFLPVGKYKLTGSIYIKPFVTVQGDWRDPDKGTEYGTVIIADVQSVDAVNPALFNIGGSAGAVGLTVWYPNQSLDNVKPYPYTFYVDGNGSNYMLQTIKNCTLINSYRGIGGSAECENGNYECHEMFNIENIKGTCLYRGLTSYNSADVDTVKTLMINGKYWANSGSVFNVPSRETLDDYTRRNLVALSLGDLEWAEFADIHVSDCLYGVRVEKGLRTTFSGTFYDLYIENCDYGLYCPEGTVMTRLKQYGIGICNGKISGSKIAVYDPGESRLMLTNVKVDGVVQGKNIHSEAASTDQYVIDYSRKHYNPSSVLYVVSADKTGKTDSSAKVRDELNKAAERGGIVYLPAGVYRFDGPVTIPSGVELRGASSVANRCQSGNSSGTLILSYYGYGDGRIESEPLITVNGDNAGISGIRINYVKNNPTDTGGNYMSTSPAIKICGNNTFVTNTSVVLSSNAISVDACNNVTLKKNVGCCYESFITVNDSDDVFVEGCLQNATTIVRNGYSSIDIEEFNGWITEDKIFDYVFNPITRKNTDYISLANANRSVIFNTFIYGGKSFLNTKNSKVLVCNVGCDGSSKDSYIYDLSGGEVTIINSMRSTSDGSEGTHSHITDGKTKLKIYNRISVDLCYHEYSLMENISIFDIEKSDFFTFLVQPFYKNYEKIGRLIMETFSKIINLKSSK